LNKQELRKQSRELKKKERQDMSLNLHAHRHEHDHKHQLTVTPFPSADEIGKYSAIDPSLPNRLFALIEKRVEADIENDRALIELEENEQDIRASELERIYSFKEKGQNYALLALVFLGILAVIFAIMDYPKIAATVIGVTILGAITAFTGLTKDDRKKNKNDELKEE
jgi:uncharacterized membrane protein